MSQDIVSDVINQIMNAKRARLDSIKTKRYSKLLLGVLAIGKLKGYIKEYRIEDKELYIKFDKLNFCSSIKPRYIVKAKDIEKYIRRYLPARDMGIIIISTNNGLITHQTALGKNIGGGLIAYFY